MISSDIPELERIIKSIKEGSDESVAFSNYLTTLCSKTDQTYSASTWPDNWRKAVYLFARVFLEKDAGPYLVIVNRFLKEDAESEIAAFFHSEIIWNYFENTSDYNKDCLRKYLRRFPHNPEFHNNYVIFLASNFTFENALDEHRTAIKLDEDNAIFVYNYFLAVKQYFEQLLKKKKITEAEVLIKNEREFLSKVKIVGLGKWDIETRLNSLSDRLNDFQMMMERVDFFEDSIEQKIRGEQKRLIEILGIFSAIIAFILTNITIATANLTARDTLNLMLGMALILIIFMIIVSMLFSSKRRYVGRLDFLKDKRLWSIVISGLALIFLM